MKNLRQRQKSDRFLIMAMTAVLLTGSLGLSFFPAARFSPAENRYLAELPAYSTEALIDGSYTAALDTYAAERFPLRASLRQARGAYEILTGRQEAGDVILCRDGSLSRRIDINERAFAQNLAALQKIHTFSREAGVPLTVAVAPCRLEARAEVLPALYDVSPYREICKQLRNALPDAKIFSDLRADAHWYRTDHHWSSAGAFAAYCTLGERLGFVPFARSAFVTKAVSNSFFGTSHSAAGLPSIEPDRIELYRYEKDDTFRVLLDGKLAPFAGFYDFDRLSTKDQYSVFFGGNHGVTEITDGTDRETLLVVKDSFANALLPFLARHYHIIAVDPRYTAQPLSDFVAQADRVLLLCGIQSLCETVFLKI